LVPTSDCISTPFLQAKEIRRSVQCPVETAVLDRFGDVGGQDALGAGQVGDRCALPLIYGVGAGAERQLFHRSAEQALGGRLEGECSRRSRAAIWALRNSRRPRKRAS
jgi:hypothetical protein